MEVFLHVGLQMAVLCTCVVIGVIARKCDFFNDDTDTRLSQVVMAFGVPCMILDSVLGNTDLPSSESIFATFGYSALIMGAICLFAAIVVRLFYRGAPRSSWGVHMFLISFGNTGQIGFAVLYALIGANGVLYGAICNISYTIFTFSVGLVFILNSSSAGSSEAGLRDREEKRTQMKQRLKEIARQLVSPCLIASLVSMFLAVYGITDTGYIGQTCDLVGSMAIPLSMMVIGSTLAKMHLKEMLGDGWSYLSSVLHLVAIPLLVYFIGGLFIADQTVLLVITIQAAMPAAVAGTMMCLTYGGDALTMARGMFITTVLSLVTIPLIAIVAI